MLGEICMKDSDFVSMELIHCNAHIRANRNSLDSTLTDTSPRRTLEMRRR